jgi:hypothetical protein
VETRGAVEVHEDRAHAGEGTERQR